MKKSIFIFANPEFDERYLCGISRIYQIFSKKYDYNIEIINEEFLKTFMPQGNSPQILIIAGGDGTIHRAINNISPGALEKYVFGIIPGGTANEFAKTLGLPPVLEQAAEIIVAQKNTALHKPGIINNKHRFLTGFLYGIACKVLLETTQAAKNYLGPYAYQLPGIFSISDYPDFVRSFRIDSSRFSTGYLLINNASLLSKGVLPGELESEDKSLFSVIYLHPEPSVGDFLRLIVENRTGENILSDPCIVYRQIGDFTLEFEGELNFMLDGEVYSLNSPIKFEHYSHDINIIVK